MSFAAAPGQFLPPANAFGFALRIRHVNDVERRGDDDAAREPRQRLHVPIVWFVSVNCPLAGEQVKRRELQIIHRVHRPAIAPISFDVVAHHLASCRCMRQQFVHIEAARDGLLKCCDFSRERCLR